MPNPSTSNVIPSYSGYDWASTAGADTALPGETQRKKKRRKRADDPIAPAPTSPRRGTGVYDPAGSGISATPAQSGTSPGSFNNAASKVTMTAPAGSVASQFPGTGSNPFGLPAAAENPMIVANQLMSTRYGLPAGSNTGAELANIFNPYDKVLGLGIDRPTSDVDWVNLGASLMGSTAQGAGQQLDPKSLMTNMVSSIVNEVNAMKAGGQGYSGGGYNPLAELAHMDPMDALRSFTSMVQGMLTGTMPDNEISGFTNFILRVGQQFAQTFYTSPDSAGMEKDGASFITFLVQQLGPSLGL